MTKKQKDKKRVLYCDVRAVSHSCNVLYQLSLVLTTFVPCFLGNIYLKSSISVDLNLKCSTQYGLFDPMASNILSGPLLALHQPLSIQTYINQSQRDNIKYEQEMFGGRDCNVFNF